ncbi:MAG: efflux RND transporter periplasmic adaptor subunit, partial [Caulobacteraceae bacterium]
PIVVVAQVDPISIVFSLPQEDIAAVQQYARNGGGGLPVTALDSAGGNVLAQGRLSSLDNLIDTTTGTVKARARFANGGSTLFPNQFVNVSLLVRTLSNQVIVPATAVRHGPQGDFVWILQTGQKVKMRPVTVGPGTPETVSIAHGVAAGETVITDGGDRLRDGGKVVLPGQARPGGGRGAGGHHRPAAASAG